MKNISLIIGLTCLTQLSAQVFQGVVPPNFKAKISPAKATITLPAIDNSVELKNANELSSKSLDKVYRFGKEVSTSFNFNHLAEATILPNGNVVKQLNILSKGAQSLNFIFEDFYLAPGAMLFITNDKREFIGAYTSINNNEAGVLGTEILKSEKVTLVLEEQKEFIGQSKFLISTIVHGFRDIDEMAKGLNSSGDCNVDVNCPQGAGWEKQRNSVAMMVNGGGFCTGSLVNNTSGNVIPYFLTARHCGTNPSNWVFRFRWESPEGQTVCPGTADSGNGPQTMNVNGATLKANNVTSDFCLVLLNNIPDPQWDIFYNGWDNSDAPTASSGAGIHHPDGDIKKISLDYDPLNQTTIAFNGGQNRTWVTNDWDVGVTEPGSSGSPLFDQNKRVIGILSGGNAACNGTDDNNEPDFYGRFGYAWDNGSSASEQLKDWLDPNNTGVTFINGFDPLATSDTLEAGISSVQNIPNVLCSNQLDPILKIDNNGSNTIKSMVIEFGLNGNYNLSQTWSGNLMSLGNVNIPLTLAVSSTGNQTFNARIASVNGRQDQKASNNSIQKSFIKNQQDFIAKLSLDLDCYGSETSWILRDANNNVIYTNNNYSDGTAGLVEQTFCLGFGCYSFEILDEYGDGLSGCNASEGGNGSYILTNENNDVVLGKIEEANANFGSSNKQNFCVLNNSIGLEENTISSRDVRLSPNPGRERLTITTDRGSIESVRIIDLTGKLVAVSIDSSDSVNMNTETLQSGMYLIEVQTNIGSITQRWMKR